MPSSSSSNKNDIKIVINPKPRRKYKRRESPKNKRRPNDAPISISTQSNPAPAYNYGGMVNKQPYDTSTSAVQRENIARENRAFLEQTRHRIVRGGSLGISDRLAESLVNDSFLDPLEQRVSSPSLTPAQQRQLSLNARTNVFGTLPPPAGHFENPDDASTSSDSFHSVVQNAGGVQQVDEGTGMEELLAHPQYREEEAQTEPTNARHSVVQTNQHFNPRGGRVASSTLDTSTGDYAELVHQPVYADYEVDTIPRDINAPLYEVPYSGVGFSLSRFLGGH